VPIFVDMTSNEFEFEFLNIQPLLQSFLYRIVGERATAEDLAQDTFLKAAANLDSFQNKSSLKTWIFAIAKNLAFDDLKARKRFADDAQDKCKTAVLSDGFYQTELENAVRNSSAEKFEVREHINFCFNCLAKTLKIEQQVAVILADIYDFKRAEIAEILDKTESVVKHLLFEGRKSLQEKYENRCALINKKGVCHQCSELNNLYNSAAESARQIAAVKFDSAADSAHLYQLRTHLIKAIDSSPTNENSFHEIVMQIVQKVEE
jgi:RNA polymerase sigma-70 factor, ECF subfamily